MYVPYPPLPTSRVLLIMQIEQVAYKLMMLANLMQTPLCESDAHASYHRSSRGDSTWAYNQRRSVLRATLHDMPNKE